MYGSDIPAEAPVMYPWPFLGAFQWLVTKVGETMLQQLSYARYRTKRGSAYPK